MIEKTAISLILAFMTTALFPDVLSCMGEICLKPDGNVVYDGYIEESGRYYINFTTFTPNFISKRYLNNTPMIPFGNDGVISLSECQCNSNFCIKKCCSFNSTMDVYTGRCTNDEMVTVNGKRRRRPKFYKKGGRKPCFGACQRRKKLFIAYLRGDMHFILKSGTLCTTYGHGPTCFRPDEFCIDYVSSPRSLAIASCHYAFVARNHTYLWKFFRGNGKYLSIFEDGAPLISILSLTVTFLVYSCFNKLRNMHGKCLLCHVASFIVHYALIISRKSRYRIRFAEPCWTTLALDIAHYLFYLAPFSWMNVICFDIFMSFMNLRPRQGNCKKVERMKFALYSLYSWTTPFLALLINFIYDLISYSGIYGVFYYAGFQIRLCDSSGTFQTIYIIYPISVYMVISVVLFVGTAIKIHRINATTSILRREERVHRREEDENKRGFKMYAKLLVVMGFISWVMEPLNYVPSHYKIFHQINVFVEYVLIAMIYVVGILKDLQGLYITVFLLWNEKVVSLLKDKALKSWAKITQHFYPQTQNVELLSPPESSSQASRNPLCSVATVTTCHGSQGSISERGYMVSENRENVSDFNFLTGKPVVDTPSPSLGGSSSPSSIPVGDANVRVSFSTASRSQETSRF